MQYENPWTYDGKAVDSEDFDDKIAFVYQITNLVSQKKYIGKKLLQKTRTKLIKGKKKKVKSESDWKTYYGSNKELINDVEKIGAENFKREILKLCKSKGTANYWEMKYQILSEVLERPDDFYNEWIICKVHRSHIKT